MTSSGRRRVLRRGLLAAVVLLSTAGCDPSFGWPQAITVQGARARGLWIGACIAGLSVGVFVWALMFWAMWRYRKRDDELPRQVRYNLPIEVLYTSVPFVIVAALFYYTARDEIFIDRMPKPQVLVQVVGFRWSWQFNYLSDSPPGRTLSVTGSTNHYPTLVLPENERVEIQLTSDDVIHAWWVPNFLFKRDNIPGRVNAFEVTITKTGTFEGHCVELCGTYHDRMQFYLKVVTPAQYKSYISGLAAAGNAAAAGPSAIAGSPS